MSPEAERAAENEDPIRLSDGDAGEAAPR